MLCSYFQYQDELIPLMSRLYFEQNMYNYHYLLMLIDYDVDANDYHYDGGENNHNNNDSQNDSDTDSDDTQNDSNDDYEGYVENITEDLAMKILYIIIMIKYKV